MNKNEYTSAGLAIHKDGRIFVTGLGGIVNRGLVFSIQSDGTGFTEIILLDRGCLVDDLVFDEGCGFYFTDMQGTSSSPTGGVYYTYPDFKKIQVVIPNLAAANGVALTPDGKELWATEYASGRLHRVKLVDAVTPEPFNSLIPYYFTGARPDSMRTDARGNMYVAMHDQGRVLVFNRSGLPIAQVLLRGREEGRFLGTTSMAIEPRTNDLYIV